MAYLRPLRTFAASACALLSRPDGAAPTSERSGTAIACPIRNHLGAVVAAINLSGPAAVMDNSVARDSYREALQQCARDISRELGAPAR